jgi:hypothetical protein
MIHAIGNQNHVKNEDVIQETENALIIFFLMMIEQCT